MMARKNTLKNLGRRGLALFLSLVMMTSLLQLNAFAAYEDQTMDGYYTVNSENTVTGTTTEAVHEEDGFKLSKTIAQTGENAFNITLKVETSQTVTTNDAAIQLVIDTSKSMSDCGEGCSSKKCSHNTRLEAIQEILASTGGFLDTLSTSNSGRILVSVVSFNSGATTAIDWTDITTATGLASVKSAINGLKQNQGTNIHAGLMLARNRLGMDAVSGAGAKYTILLSDGEANRTAKESTSTTSISGSGSGNATSNAASMATELKALSSVYAVGYGVTKSYLESIVGAGDHVLVGADSVTISAAFANIAQSATSGMSGAGTTVTDPMGDYIVLGDVTSLASSNVAAANGTITWTLDPEKATKSTSGNTTTYTYTITYPITLDTFVEGFQENVYYPTNDFTCLNVTVNGVAKQIPFNVPGVCGKIPEVNWTIEYYLQDESSIGAEPTYTLDKDAAKGPVELWTTVNAPDGYETEYTAKDYKFDHGNIQMQITPTGENVMRLYYNIITASVTVNHYYKTDTILADGTSVPGTYPDTADKTSSHDQKIDTQFTAISETTFGGYEYTLERSTPGMTITVTENGDNVIDLYYTRLDDQRVITSAEVDHVYTTYGYELQNGKYVLVEQGSVTADAETAAEVRATTVFNVSDKPLAGYEDFTLNTEKGDYAELLQDNGTLSFVVAENAAENKRVLHFEKVVDDRQAISVTVNHYYTKTTTTVENGVVTTTVNPDNVLGYTDTAPAYVGESFTAAELNGYNGDTYVSDAGNAAKLYIDALTGNVTIDLYYSLTEAPAKTSLIVNHYWRTYTEVTKELTETTTDENGNEVVTVIGTTTEIVESLDNSSLGNVVDNLYIGESYTAPQESWGTGYTYNTAESNDTGIAGTDAVLNLYYDKFATDDIRADADITVQHNYTTYLTTIVNGKVETITLKDGSTNESHTGLAGDTFTATPAPEYNGNAYTQTTADEALTRVLQPGTNATIVIDYVREASDLVDTGYAVNYEYRTYTMTINDEGVAVYGEPDVETVDGASGDGYVGQQIALDAGNREGFAPLATNPATTQILKTEGNTWTFVHEKYIPLEKGSVVVNHHYTTETIAIDGTSTSNTESVYGTSVEKYIGESYTALAELNGFEQTALTVDGAAADLAASVTVAAAASGTVVDFYYKKVVDNSVLALYSIAHEYYLYDWDGTLLSESKPEPATGTGYVTTQITGSPEPNDYTLVGATYNGDALAAPYSINLIDGANDIVFTYEKVLPRDILDVTVIHNYYQDEAALTAGADPLNVYQETATVEEESDYTAQTRDEAGYTFHSAAPETMTITVTEDGNNVIILNYIRTSAAYEIVHIYNTNGVEDGRTSTGHGGYVGDVIAASGIAPVTTYNGNDYDFTSVTGDITLEADEVKAITLTYDRTVITPPDPPAPPADPKYPEVVVTKTASGASFAPGAEITWTITVKNIGEVAAYNVDVTDEVPAGLTVIAGEETTWTIAELAAGAEEVFTVKTTVAADAADGAKIANVAVATWDDDNDPETPQDPANETKDDEEITVDVPENPPYIPPYTPPVTPNEPVIDIPDEDVPLTELPDEEIPLAEVPKTGDSKLYYILTALSGTALLGLVITGRKREEEEMA